MKDVLAGIVLVLTAQLLVGQTGPHVPVGIVSDWTHHHVLTPDSQDYFLLGRIGSDPRRVENWYLRHPEAWWPEQSSQASPASPQRLERSPGGEPFDVRL